MLTSEFPAILFGGDTADSALGFARSLARNGLTVYWVTSMKNEARFSKYLKECFIVPDIETDLDRLNDFLVRFQDKHRLGVVFPGSDNLCLNLASVKNRLDKGTCERFHFLLPPKEIAETLVNKKKFYESLSRKNIPHPLSYFPESIDDIMKISHEVDYPVCVKPYLSQVFASVFKVKGYLAKTKEELIGYYSLATKNGVDVLIQEYILGPNDQIFGVNAYFDKKNNPRGLFAYRRIRGWPRDFGYGSLIESIPLSSMPEVKTVVDYLRGLGHHGLADAEFKMDPRDGSFKFLEVNPRVWAQNSFPAKCGINLNLIAYLDAINCSISHKWDYRTGIKWMNTLGDLMSAMKMLSRAELSVSEWMSSLQRIDDWCYSPADDFLPWILNLIFSPQRFVKGRLLQKRARMDTSADKVAILKCPSDAKIQVACARARAI